MKKEAKWNYATVRSVFGDVWVGKTKLKADNKKIFTTFEAAEEVRKQNISAADFENEMEDEHTAETCDVIGKGIEKFIRDVRN